MSQPVELVGFCKAIVIKEKKVPFNCLIVSEVLKLFWNENFEYSQKRGFLEIRLLVYYS